MQIPTKYEWVYDSDRWFRGQFECALECYLGLSIEEAESFLGNHFNRIHFYAMSSIPFRYYIRSYVNYLIRFENLHDIAAASFFLDLVETKLGLGGPDTEDIFVMWTPIKKALDQIGGRNMVSGWDEDLYGNPVSRVQHVALVKDCLDRNLPLP